jgi:uroporphyrinogen-III synthase
MRRETLPEALANAKIDFNEIEVYKTVLSPHKINSTLNGILFYSPSGIESYLKENNIGDAVCFCIGTTTAEALKGITENIVIANKPTVENLIIQCINYYKETN